MGVKLSIIIPWRGGNLVREEHLKRCIDCMTVQDSASKNEVIEFEIIIVEQANQETCDSAKVKTLSMFPIAAFEKSPKLIKWHGFKYIQLRSEETGFNKSWCMNVGARAAKFDILVFFDADSLFGADYFRYIVFQMETTPFPNNQIMVGWNYLMALPGKDNPIARNIRPDMVRTLGGVWAAWKSFYFNKFGGMNENFCGYGGEDNEGYERACVLLKLSNLSYMSYPLAHQYHDWEVPHPAVVGLFEKGRACPMIVTERLIKAGLGKLEAPTFIKMEDLT